MYPAGAEPRHFKAMPSDATTMLSLPTPAITPPATPTIIPMTHTGRLPNLLHSGATKNTATAMGTAPMIPNTPVTESVGKDGVARISA